MCSFVVARVPRGPRVPKGPQASGNPFMKASEPAKTIFVGSNPQSLGLQSRLYDRLLTLETNERVKYRARSQRGKSPESCKDPWGPDGSHTREPAAPLQIF